MPHLLIAGKMHPAGLALLKDVDGVTYDYVEEVSEPSYAPLIGKADGLVIRTQPLSAATIAEARQLKIVSVRSIRSSLRMVGLKELSTRPLRWRMDLPGQTSFRSTCRRPLDRFWALRNLRS